MKIRTIIKWALFTLATLGLAILIYFGVKAIRGAIYRLHGHWKLVGVLTLGIILLLYGIGGYFIDSIPIQQAQRTIDVKDTRFYIDNGLFTQTHYMQYYALPTSITQPDVVYQVDVGNDLVTWRDKVYWSKLELGIGKPKLIKKVISEDEYNALAINPRYTTVVNEVRSEYSPVYLAIPVVYFGILALVWMNKRQRVALNYAGS